MSLKNFINQRNYLESIIRSCRLCQLHRTRIQAVPGNETTLSGLMMIREGPGFYEDQEGRRLAFYGKSRKIVK